LQRAGEIPEHRIVVQTAEHAAARRSAGEIENSRHGSFSCCAARNPAVGSHGCCRVSRSQIDPTSVTPLSRPHASSAALLSLRLS
jgi:hypothetical protein